MNVIAEKLRQAYHNDLTDVPILLDGADEIDKLCEALERFNAETIALTKRVEELDEQSRAAFEALRAERDRLRERVVKLERSQLETSIENTRLREALDEAYQFLIDLPVRGPKLERARVLGIKIRTALAKEIKE